MVGGIPNICDDFGIAILHMDSNYNILDVDINKEIAVLKYKVSGELVGKNFLDIVSEEYKERIKEIMESVENKGKKADILRSPERDFWTYIRVSKMGNYFVVLLVDVTGMINEKREQMEKQKELDIINKVMRNVSGTLDIEDICRKSYKEISKYIPRIDSFVISLVDENRGEIRAEYIVGRGKRYKRRKYPLNDRDTLTGWVALHRKELYIKNVKKDKLPANYKLVGHPMLSWLGIPLIHRNRVIGVLSVQSESDNAFSDRDIRLLRIIAKHISSVISNALLHKELKKREQMYESLVNNGLVGIVMVDKNQRLTFVNNAVATVMGFDPKKIIGRSVYEFATEKGRESMERGHERRKMGITEIYESELRKKDGTVIPVAIYAAPLKDENGKFAGTLGIVADISKIKEMETKIKESKEFLEVLLHIISHDLKNYFAVISGYGELITEEPRKEYGKQIVEAVEQANDMLLRIRELIRMESEGSSIEKENYALKDIVDEVIAMALRVYPDGKIESKVENLELCGNRILMKEAIENIVMNAFKHGSTEVKIVTRRKDGKIIIRIADNGPGISDENKEKIFKPFVKFGSGGSGLGLYIVKRVISLHGGNVWVEDNVPKGSVFVIELPMVNKCK